MVSFNCLFDLCRAARGVFWERNLANSFGSRFHVYRTFGVVLFENDSLDQSSICRLGLFMFEIEFERWHFSLRQVLSISFKVINWIIL